MPFTPSEIHYLPIVLSAPRFARYLHETNGDKVTALELYRWNLQMSSSLLAPLSIFEVTIRNAISEAIEATYGPLWPWSQSFLISLPNPAHLFSPRNELLTLRSKHPTAGKIIADTKFAFWQSMFTARHDAAIWNHHFFKVLPNANQGLSVQVARKIAHDSMNSVRELRNRIAHHEPIFGRNIIDEFGMIKKLIGWRSSEVLGWLEKIETVTAEFASRP